MGQQIRMSKGTMKVLNQLKKENPNIVECRVFIDKETGMLYFAIEDEIDNSNDYRIII